MNLRLEVEEGSPFDLPTGDRAYLARVLRGAIRWAEQGMVIWNVVGHLRLPSGTTLIVRSRKAPSSCLLAWASYVDPALSDLKHLRQFEMAGADGDIGQALASLFVRELLSVAGANGLRRRYRRIATRSATLRGSIDFGALARIGGDLSRTPCTVWERLPRTPLNQFLAAALQVIRRDWLMREVVGGALHDLEAVLVDVAPVVDPDLLAGRRPLARDELAYAPACALARLLLRNAGLGTGGSSDGLGFLVRINDLFEQAVMRGLKDAGLPVVSKWPAAYSRVHHDGTSSAEALELDGFLPTTLGGIVVDAKYKSDASQDTVNQMVTYCHLMGAARAALVFPAGQLTDKRRFELAAPDGRVIRIDLVEFDTSVRSLAAWRANGRATAEKLS